MTSVIMAVVMMFAMLGVTAFAEGSLSLSYVGYNNKMTVKGTYSDCDQNHVISDGQFKLNVKTSITLKFNVSVNRATILFYKSNETDPRASFTTPAYFPGMPSTMETSITLNKGIYDVKVCSCSSTSDVSGNFEIRYVSAIGNIDRKISDQGVSVE